MKPSMSESWWQAHELEFWTWGVIFGLFAFIWLVESIAAIRRERAQRRKDGLL